VRRVRAENLQRSVDGGHETRCRDSQRKDYARFARLRNAPMSSTKQKKHSTPLLTRRAALTKPSGTLLRKGRLSARGPVLQTICEGW